jgi:hypothetical protein
MPIREYKRLWCKKCNDWELFEQQYPNPKELFCNECETVYANILLSEIPEEKLIEQRERYNEKQKESYTKLFGDFMSSPEQRNIKELAHMFSPPGSDWETEIIESDAGQHTINEAKRKKREEEINARIEEKEKVKQYLLKFKKIKRNDSCPCESGKKYKKCCLEKVNFLLLQYNLRF